MGQSLDNRRCNLPQTQMWNLQGDSKEEMCNRRNGSGNKTCKETKGRMTTGIGAKNDTAGNKKAGEENKPNGAHK